MALNKITSSRFGQMIIIIVLSYILLFYIFPEVLSSMKDFVTSFFH